MLTQWPVSKIRETECDGLLSKCLTLWIARLATYFPLYLATKQIKENSSNESNLSISWGCTQEMGRVKRMKYSVLGSCMYRSWGDDAKAEPRSQSIVKKATRIEWNVGVRQKEKKRRS